MTFGWESFLRIKCLSGYFKFSEVSAGQVSRFVSLYGFALTPKDDYYTFEALKDAPKYSLLGKSYLGLPATKTYEGEPWEVMRENGFVYNFALGTIVPEVSVTQLIKIENAGNYYTTSGLILPGSVTEDGSRVKEYSAWYSFDRAQFRYSEVTFE